MGTIRIGTRGSKLALYQAKRVLEGLRHLGQPAVLKVIETKGDRIQDRPLQSLGTGIFTKALDDALVANEVDIAVHSMKDVPTELPLPLESWAVLERGNPLDVLVLNDTDLHTVATGSIRRKAQWLHRYPQDKVVGLRGNVETRLAKVHSNPWHGGIFAAAGLERLDLLKDLSLVKELDWMVPAPAQGSILVVGRSNNEALRRIVFQLNHAESALAASIERSFLLALEGGCAAPIGAIAEVTGSIVRFVGCLNSLDGSNEIRIERESAHGRAELGALWAQELLALGGKMVMDEIRQSPQTDA